MKEELLAKNPYQRDHKFVQDESFVIYLEGIKGELAKEWRGGSQELQDYRDFDGEARDRALAFIRRSAEAKKPFFVSWRPLWISFIPEAQKTTIQRGMVGGCYRTHSNGPHYRWYRSNGTDSEGRHARPPVDLKKLPFDPLEFIEHLDQIPFDPSSEPGPGQ
jgi:hypothetical protein